MINILSHKRVVRASYKDIDIPREMKKKKKGKEVNSIERTFLICGE